MRIRIKEIPDPYPMIHVLNYFNLQKIKILIWICRYTKRKNLLHTVTSYRKAAPNFFISFFQGCGYGLFWLNLEILTESRFNAKINTGILYNNGSKE